jgi:hypothetical protein
VYNPQGINPYRGTLDFSSTAVGTTAWCGGPVGSQCGWDGGVIETTGGRGVFYDSHNAAAGSDVQDDIYVFNTFYPPDGSPSIVVTDDAATGLATCPGGSAGSKCTYKD